MLCILIPNLTDTVNLLGMIPNLTDTVNLLGTRPKPIHNFTKHGQKFHSLSLASVLSKERRKPKIDEFGEGMNQSEF
jgi:hypothetical protein